MTTFMFSIAIALLPVQDYSAHLHNAQLPTINLSGLGALQASLA
jgi:hypothetical protein